MPVATVVKVMCSENAVSLAGIALVVSVVSATISGASLAWNVRQFRLPGAQVLLYVDPYRFLPVEELTVTAANAGRQPVSITEIWAQGEKGQFASTASENSPVLFTSSNSSSLPCLLRPGEVVNFRLITLVLWLACRDRPILNGGEKRYPVDHVDSPFWAALEGERPVRC
jgi:hypothetical protein